MALFSSLRGSVRLWTAALGVVLEFVVQGAFTPRDRVGDADPFSLEAGELPCREIGLEEKTPQPARSGDDVAVLR
jgi:hypothetical protein